VRKRSKSQVLSSEGKPGRVREDESSGSEDEDNELPRVIRGESGLATRPTGLGKVLKVNVET